MDPYYQDDCGVLYNCDVLEALPLIPSESVNLIVTSPPYWGLRDYGVDGQIGLEENFVEFLGKLVKTFEECKRILRPDGNLYINMGDSYSGSGKGAWAKKDVQKAIYVPDTNGKQTSCRDFLPPKNLVGQPWRLAFALQDAGWYLREDIIWSKPNPMPESVADRCTRAHEYIFHFTKNPQYYYDAFSIKTDYAPKTATAWGNAKGKAADGSGKVKAENFLGLISQPKDWCKKDKQRGHSRTHAGLNERWDNMSRAGQPSMGANKRSVWTVATKPFKGAHFATFPPELIESVILAACPEGGVVYDPFHGAGTTAVVAEKHGRKWIGSELNTEYAALSIRRIQEARGITFIPTKEGLVKQPTIEDFIAAQS